MKLEGALILRVPRRPNSNTQRRKPGAEDCRGDSCLAALSPLQPTAASLQIVSSHRSCYRKVQPQSLTMMQAVQQKLSLSFPPSFPSKPSDWQPQPQNSRQHKLKLQALATMQPALQTCPFPSHLPLSYRPTRNAAAHRAADVTTRTPEVVGMTRPGVRPAGAIDSASWTYTLRKPRANCVVWKCGRVWRGIRTSQAGLGQLRQRVEGARLWDRGHSHMQNCERIWSISAPTQPDGSGKSVGECWSLVRHMNGWVDGWTGKAVN
eukprot:364851-Chlamydomonas_euryale.AAC.5